MHHENFEYFGSKKKFGPQNLSHRMSHKLVEKKTVSLKIQKLIIFWVTRKNPKKKKKR